MSAIQVKNTMLHLNGQNLSLAAKNSRSSKTPGHHASVTYEKEVAGRFIAPSLTQGGTTQLDSLLKSLRPPSESEVCNQQVRRPRTLAPLELPEEVRVAQRQKLKQQIKPPNENRKVKSPVGSRLTRAAVCPTVSNEPHRATNRCLKPQLIRSTPVELKGDSQLEEVVCRGTLAPLHTMPRPPTPQIRAQATCGIKASTQHPSSLLQDTRRRRLRLRRTQCLEEDQQLSDKSTADLSVKKGNLAQGVQGRGERTARGQHHTGKGISQPPAASMENRSIRKSHQEHRSQNRPAVQSGRRESVLDGVRPSASNWRLGRKKTLGPESFHPSPSLTWLPKIFYCCRWQRIHLKHYVGKTYFEASYTP